MNKDDKELLQEKFKGVYLHQQTNFNLVNVELKKILDQVTLTNSRVTSLEKYTSILKFFQKHPIITGLVIVGCWFIFTSYDMQDLIKLFK